MQKIPSLRYLRLLTLFMVCCWLLAAPSAPQAAAFAPSRSKDQGMVRSSHPLADAIGTKVLQKGGNAVDAAVAMGYALAVAHPAAGNIGGGGFAVIHMEGGEDITLDFRETAPLAATRDMYLDGDGKLIEDAATIGYRAAGVPGTVAGMSALLDRFGTMALKELMRPAIELAEKGVVINARQEAGMAEHAPRFAKFASSRKYFMKEDGTTYKEGDILVQKDLGAALRLIARLGPSAFYTGKVGELLVADMQRNEGLISMEDLAAYKVVWREPVRGSYRGHEIISMGPPSSGGAHIIQMLNIMEHEDIGAMGFASSRTIHLMAEAMRYAFADRSEYMGDPDFVNLPLAQLLSKEYAGALYEKIRANKDKAAPSETVRPGLPLKESENTTHYSVVDKMGNAVAVTYTINDSYGSAAAVEGAGFLLNNEMDDFSAKPGVPNMYGLIGNEANSIAPQKRPLSCMSPSIVLKDGKLLMVLGSPGGSRIITTVLQVVSNVIDHGMNISEAVTAPRIHMQWQPDELRVEKYGLVKDVEDRLREMGYSIEVKKPMGDVNAIYLDQESGVLYGTGDPRAEF